MTTQPTRSRRNDIVTAYPEVITSLRNDVVTTERWTVDEGSSNRGDAYTNFVDRVLRIPLVNDETARVVRAHENVHVRVSPSDMEAYAKFAEVHEFSDRVLKVAEEHRVNTIVGRLGYDLNLLRDGSEKESGKRTAKEATKSVTAYNELFSFGAGLVGTKAFRDYINGVRSVDKDMAVALRKMELAILKVTKRVPTKRLGDTQLVAFHHEESEPFTSTSIGYGFACYTRDIAKIVQSYLRHEGQDGSDMSAVQGASGIDYAIGGKEGFAPLQLDHTLLCNTQVKGHLARRKRASSTGKRVLYPSRLLTDPHKRIFTTKPRNNGGVVVIDCSGSMALTNDDVDKFLELAPGALVIAYSHSNRKPNKPNTWVIANRGKRADDITRCTKNGGNGVDGPALEYAIAHRRGSEPIIWICDGQVTSSTDNYVDELAQACAKIVIKHNIIVAPTVDAGIKALSQGRSARSIVQGGVGQYVPRARGGKA
jgi:hypothetical protein